MPERKTRPDTRWLGRLLAANLRCYSHKRLKGKSLEHGGHGGHGDARAKPTRPDTRWLGTSACSKLAPAKLPFVTSVTSVFKLCSAAPHLRTCKLLVFCSRILPFRAVGSHSLLTGSPGLGTARLVLGLAAQCNCTSSGPNVGPDLVRRGEHVRSLEKPGGLDPLSWLRPFGLLLGPVSGPDRENYTSHCWKAGFGAVR